VNEQTTNSLESQVSPAPPVELVEKADFSQFGLSPKILQAVAEQGYTHPTPIQEQAIPHVLAGRDVMGAAQTGTGKTAAFVLPILEKIFPLANTSSSPARHPIRALVLTPTRELSDQVAENAFKYSKNTDLRTAVVFGGVDISSQTQLLRAGVELLIATPGRLLDHISQKNANLSQVQILVLDEADRMLDMGFLPDLQKILSLIPADSRQTLLFSATFSPEIKKLAQQYLKDPVLIEVSRQNQTADTVTQMVHLVDASSKVKVLQEVLKQRKAKGYPNQCIIFANSRLGCAKLSRTLSQIGFKAEAIHGDKSQIERMSILDQFKKSEIDILVATDVAARGLDIPSMPCVINYELPFNAEDYVHRIGRTGRAGAKGDAIALVDPSELKLLAEIEKLTKKPLIRIPVPTPSAQNSGDPFFYMPYEDKSSAPELSLPANTNSITKKPTASKALGALLGGIKKS
jgi:superfamily II DNA/RNA helicase